MSSNQVKKITKDNHKYIQDVFEYRNRTIATLFVLNTEELKAKWSEAQIELGSKYQYQGEGRRIWDYYLAICCNFDENSMKGEDRFNIENDRFCCRKVFIFNQSPTKFSPQKLIHELFPKIQSTEKIALLKPEIFISNLEPNSKITNDFFFRSWDQAEIDKLANALIVGAPLDDKNNKN